MSKKKTGSESTNMLGRVYLVLPKELKEEAVRIANLKGMTLSEVIRGGLHSFIQAKRIMNIQVALRKLRENKGLNRLELSKELGIHPEAVKHFETGVTKPHDEMIEKIADFFGVPLYLLKILALDESKMDDRKRVQYITVSNILGKLIDG